MTTSAPSSAPSSALSSVGVAAGDRRMRDGACLKYFYGPMDCGKSTLALQMHYNHSRQGRTGLVLTRHGLGFNTWDIPAQASMGRVMS